jgi:hypothetical protein
VSFEDAKILKNLEDWELEAELVSEELLNALIEYVAKRKVELELLKVTFDQEVHLILEEFKNSEKSSIDIDYNYVNYTYRFAQGEAYLSREVPDYDYYSLMAGASNNLLKWIKRGKNGEEEVVEFEDYGYYPALNVDTQELAYLRVHTSRITYRITSYTHHFKIKNKDQSVGVDFVKPSKNGGNIKMTIKPDNEEDEATFEFFFNGKNFILKKEKYSNLYYKKFLKDNLFDKPIIIKRFLFELIEPYKFTTKRDALKDIEKFAPKWYYTVGILDISGFPMLIFKAV